jgi:aminopeptidase N
MGWNKYSGGSYVTSEPAGAFTWFPVNDHPCDKATYTMNVTAPKPLVVAANGTLKNVIDHGQTQTYSWVVAYPMASYLATVDIGNFVEKTSKSKTGVVIQSYFDKSLQDKENYFDRTGDQIDFFSQLYGPYPFDRYGVVVIDAPFNYALETQTMSIFGQAWLKDANTTEMVSAHELAHQWFGDSVSLKTWKDIWLNEGFATYSQWLWAGNRFGQNAIDSTARDWYNKLNNSDNTPPGDPGKQPNQLFGPSVYDRGALTLYALRAKVGDDDFFQIMREYAGRYAYGNAGTDDFIAVAEEISGQDLKSFFQGWLYDPKMPPFPGS